jgi:VTC domain
MSSNVPQDARLEIKFVADASHTAAIVNWFELHPACFGDSFPARWVNNVYFDTHDYHAFRQNLLGSSSRQKVRYRWYGQDELPSRGALEIKCRRNFFGWKLCCAIDSAPCLPGDSWRDVRRKLLPQLTVAGRVWLEANPQAVILNRYFRRYLVSHDNRVRVTIDDQQSVYDQRYKPYPNVRHAANLPTIVIVELKLDRVDRAHGARVIQGLPLRVSRHSKYVIGVRWIHGF